VTTEEAAEVAHAFLHKYVMDNRFFTPEEEFDDGGDPTYSRLSFIRAMAHESKPNTIRIFLNYGRYFHKGDPEFDELVKQCIDALLEAHPELKTFELDITTRRQT
jgi:hypothetical protein